MMSRAWTAFSAAACRGGAQLMIIMLGLVGAADLAWADWSEVASLYGQARFGAAAQLSDSLSGEGEAPAEAIIWRVRLENDPEQALALIRESREDSDLPRELRTQLALEEAGIHFAREDYESALVPLEALAEADGNALPGELRILQGLANWGLGRIQSSREALASVPQSDPAFGWARYYLGRIGLAQGKIELALRYFESAGKGDLAPRIPALLAGAWEGMRLSGRSEDARKFQEDLLDSFPHSLALLQVNHGLATEEIRAQAAPAADPGVETEPTPPAPPAAAYRLQLAAFSDRGRALAYMAEWDDSLPDLMIAAEQTEAGKLLYKVRYGSFASRDQARTEAERIARAHDLKALVVESGP